MSTIPLPRSVRWASAALFIALAVPAVAQDGAPAETPPTAAPPAETPPAAATPAEVTPTHLAAARKAITAIHATDQFDTILLNAATQIKSELILNNPDRQTEISTMVDNKALELAPRRGALENEVARIYAGMFTEPELKDIADFYNSEAGKKLLAQGPAATQEMLSSAEVWGNGIVRDLRGAAVSGMNTIYGEQTPADASESGEAGAQPAEQ